MATSSEDLAINFDFEISAESKSKLKQNHHTYLAPLIHIFFANETFFDSVRARATNRDMSARKENRITLLVRTDQTFIKGLFSIFGVFTA